MPISQKQLGGRNTRACTTIAPAAAANVAVDGGVEHTLINNAATLASLTLTLPAAPVDGQVQAFSSRSNVTTLTLAAGATGRVIHGGPTTLTAAAPFRLVYSATANAWFRAV